MSAPIVTFRVGTENYTAGISPTFYTFWKNAWHFTFLVFYSLERTDDPCKSDSQTFYPFWKNAWHFTTVKLIAQHFTFVDEMRDTVPFLVFNSLERKDDPSDNPTFYPFRKNAGHSLVLLDKFCVLILLVAIVAKFI